MSPSEVMQIIKGYVRVNCWRSQTPKAARKISVGVKAPLFDRRSSIRVRDTEETCPISRNRPDKMLRWRGVSCVSSEVKA